MTVPENSETSMLHRVAEIFDGMFRDAPAAAPAGPGFLTLADMLATVIRPTLAAMGARYASPEAEVALLAIHLQEDPMCTRCQVDGPARGAWQFEPNGVLGVLAHDRSAHEAHRVAVEAGFGDDPDWHAITAAMEHDDRLACAFARLLLWTDPHPLPDLGSEDDTFRLYLRLWRPGRPRPDVWPRSYGIALQCVLEAPQEPREGTQDREKTSNSTESSGASGDPLAGQETPIHDPGPEIPDA